MNRRALLKTGGMAILGMGFGGCATSKAARTAPAAGTGTGVPPRSLINLPLVNISWERVIRTTVGLRPHRPSGFVLKAAKLDAKTVIHNYGHGGTGHSLGWGTGAIAADMALVHADRRAAVLGCGTVGLTAARQLQRRGFDVTIYTATVPPDTTSNMALAGFTPTSGLVEGDKRTPEWEAQFRQAAEISYRQLQLLVGSHFGVSWMDSYSPSDDPRPNNGGGGEGNATAGLLPEHLRAGQEILQPGEHPFPTKYAIRRPGIRIEPSIYLDALLREVMLFGGHLVIRKFDSPRDLIALNESLIVNCTGLGSRALFGDEELMPIKGQLTLLVPQPEINYRTGGGLRASNEPGGGSFHMMPRSDGIALGGTSERGIWSMEPNEDARKRVVEGHIELYTAMKPPAPGVRFARSEGPRETPRLESFFGHES